MLTRTARAVSLIALTVLPAYAALPPLQPNSLKYKDTGAQPARGRSGYAWIETRALRGQTDTQIEVGANSLDPRYTWGSLDKVQLKVYDSNGSVIVTDNYRKGSLSGGYGSFTYDFPIRGQKIQVQANVSGFEPNRTDVVTVDTEVKLRPDLEVTDLWHYPKAWTGYNTIIDAFVSERNGDVGARSTCQLRVDGNVVDRAEGIWVNAGDTVLCEFSHRFTSAGIHNFTVEAVDVAPGDYDESNNSASGSIEVEQWVEPVNYTMIAYDRNVNTKEHSQSQQYYFPVVGSPWYTELTTDSDRNDRTVGYQALMFVNQPMTFPISAKAILASDGQTLMSADFAIDQMRTESGAGWQRQCGSSFASVQQWSVCVTTGTSGGYPYGYTQVTVEAHGGSVTYYSWNVSNNWELVDNGYYYSYSYETSWVNQYGQQPPPLGNYVEVYGAFTDANATTYDARASVQLFPIDRTSYSGPFCGSWTNVFPEATYSGSQCYTRVLHTTGKEGRAVGADRQ